MDPEGVVVSSAAVVAVASVVVDTERVGISIEAFESMDRTIDVARYRRLQLRQRNRRRRWAAHKIHWRPGSGEEEDGGKKVD